MYYSQTVGEPNVRVVVWVYRNPVIRSKYEHYRVNDSLGQPSDNIQAEVLFDPVGASVWMTDPCVQEPIPPGPPPDSNYANIINFAGGCYIDGIEAPCDTVLSLINNGAIANDDSSSNIQVLIKRGIIPYPELNFILGENGEPGSHVIGFSFVQPIQDNKPKPAPAPTPYNLQPQPVCYITLVAKKIGMLNEHGVGVNAYHLFVLTKQSGQNAQMIYHALGENGKIKAEVGNYDESDWDYQDVKKGGPWGSVEAVDDVQGSCDRINKNFASTIGAIKAANINYDMWGDNSNATAYTLLYRLDKEVLKRLSVKLFPKLVLTMYYPTSIPGAPVPPLVPGWGRNLLSR